MQVSTIAGSGEGGSRDGVGAEASFDGPGGLAISSDGKKLYVADGGNNRIRCIALGDSAQVTTIAGNGTEGSVDGVGTSTASFNSQGLALSCGKKLFVSDFAVTKSGAWTLRTTCASRPSPVQGTMALLTAMTRLLHLLIRADLQPQPRATSCLWHVVEWGVACGVSL